MSGQDKDGGHGSYGHCDMSSDGRGPKRARTQQQDGAGEALDQPGREQLLLSAALQICGRKFCDETELLPLMLAHGLVRRVRTIQVEIRPLGGDSFKVTLDMSARTVGEAKAEIARSQGTAEARQELYKVAERADGLAVREDDAEPELLEDLNMLLEANAVVAMAVKDLPPLSWRIFSAGRVALSEDGAVVTQTLSRHDSLTTTEIELTEGKHYWEVELLSKSRVYIPIGISRPNLDPTVDYGRYDCADVWFIDALDGSLYGNRKEHDDEAGGYTQGDRVGLLLDLDNGSLRFFQNGVQHGPGYPAGSVTGPVVHAVQMFHEGSSVRLLPNAEVPAGV
jgi:hypothetical protein